MKRILIALFCVLLSANAFADQLIWVSKQEAESAVKLLKKQKVVLLHCGCWPIDLAYAHIKEGKIALCVGVVLDLECDPCVDYIKWDCPAF